jgi:hypothetical protein
MSPTAIGYIMFGSTVIAVIALFAVGVLPFWLAAVILLFDGFLTYFVVSKIEAAGNR